MELPVQLLEGHGLYVSAAHRLHCSGVANDCAAQKVCPVRITGKLPWQFLGNKRNDGEDLLECVRLRNVRLDEVAHAQVLEIVRGAALVHSGEEASFNLGARGLIRDGRPHHLVQVESQRLAVE